MSGGGWRENSAANESGGDVKKKSNAHRASTAKSGIKIWRLGVSRENQQQSGAR